MSFVPNHLLAAARGAFRFTQEELAERANTQVEADTGRPGAMDADYVSKLERGVHTWPSKHYRQALRAVLRVDADADLGFYSNRRKAVTVMDGPFEDTRGSDDVKRQAFLRGAAAIVAGSAVGSPATEAIIRAATGDTPSRVGSSEVHQVDHAVDVFGQWQDMYGGGACKGAIAEQVKWASGLLHADSTDQVKRDLYRSVGFFADVAGWGAFDAGHHNDARRYFKLALDCAEQVNDWGLRANVLSDMARQAIYIGEHDDGLSLIELAQVRQDRLTPTARAMLSTVRARTLAKANRGEESYGAVLTAEDHFSNRNPSDDPVWIAYFNEADLAGDSGHGLLDVALTGKHVDDARQRLKRSVDFYAQAQARAQAFSLSKLAILELKVGDADRGVIHARQALAAAAPLNSQRAKDDLVSVCSALAQHTALPGVPELRVEISRALKAT